MARYLFIDGIEKLLGVILSIIKDDDCSKQKVWLLHSQ